ncbi:MAG: Biopolymer transport protein ExbD/TolR [Bacteroidetes bacterium ADurb.Bin217]|nr:MAG: Biopolymer transport protein ExbD/TolR [Bacteroidetes bacterium ADurb.Bin217]HOS84157.1 biopolymer transporter ExbD [Bacteroidales bacterium]
MAQLQKSCAIIFKKHTIMARRPFPEINSASMADIAFMLLIFFLVATTMDSDKGIFRVLPPYIDKPIQDEPIKVLDKNLFVVLINKDDRLMVEKKPMHPDDLRKACKDFLTNMNNDEADKIYPEYNVETIEGIGNVKVTKGIVSIQNDRGTSYDKYIEIQNEIVAAYNEVKDEYSKQYFRKPFKDLNEDQQKAIKALIPQRISEAEPKNIGGK